MRATDNVIPFQRARDVRPRPLLADRLSLWELPGGALCPTVGTCLGIGALRQLLDALFEGTSAASDFELHAGVVRECGSRNKLSEMLQRELDALYAADIEQLREVSDEAVLGEAWERATVYGPLAGTLWAVMTHGACTDSLRERLLCEMHMLHHQCIVENQRFHGASAEVGRERDRLHEALATLRSENEALMARLQGAPTGPRKWPGQKAQGTPRRSLLDLFRSARAGFT